MMPQKALFAAEYEPAIVGPNRNKRRAPVSLNARVGQGGLDRTLCKVVDLSPDGARLQAYSEMRQGSMIWLTLPLIGQVAALIKWARDFEAGCQFREPLDAAQFDEMVALAGR
jgi:hypothetical protein